MKGVGREEVEGVRMRCLELQVGILTIRLEGLLLMV